MNVQRAFGSLFEGLSALWRELLHGPARLGPAPVDLEPIVDVICAAGDWTRTSVASATHASGVRVEVTDFDGALVTLSPPPGHPRGIDIPACMRRDDRPWPTGTLVATDLHVTGDEHLLDASQTLAEIAADSTLPAPRRLAAALHLLPGRAEELRPTLANLPLPEAATLATAMLELPTEVDGVMERLLGDLDEPEGVESQLDMLPELAERLPTEDPRSNRLLLRWFTRADGSDLVCVARLLIDRGLGDQVAQLGHRLAATMVRHPHAEQLATRQLARLPEQLLDMPMLGRLIVEEEGLALAALEVATSAGRPDVIAKLGFFEEWMSEAGRRKAIELIVGLDAEQAVSVLRRQLLAYQPEPVRMQSLMWLERLGTPAAAEAVRQFEDERGRVGRAVRQTLKRRFARLEGRLALTGPSEGRLSEVDQSG